MKQREVVNHTFPPFFDENSEILLLGSMPSRKSRECSFYYMHPQNRFWKVLASVYEAAVPETLEEKKSFLYQHKIALWDCIESCEIIGSADASIRNVVPTDLNSIIQKSHIEQVFTTGKKAQSLYEKYHYAKTGMEAISLPSTSPANIANYKEQDLIDAYQIIRKKKPNES